MKTIAWALVLTLFFSTSSYAVNCKKKDDSRHIEFQVSNNLKHDWLYLDMGDPTHGIITGGMDIPPNDFAIGIGCSDGLLTGFQSYIRLYRMPVDHPKSLHYLEEFYVWLPYATSGGLAINYTRDSSLCDVTLQNQGWWLYWDPNGGTYKNGAWETRWKIDPEKTLKTGMNKIWGNVQIVRINCKPPA